MKLTRSAFLALGIAGAIAPLAVMAQPEPMKLGTKPQNFTLDTPSGQQQSLFTPKKTKATVVIFIATRCPVSLAYDDRMAALGREYQAKGVRFIAVNANRREPMAEVGDHAKKHNYPFPVVKDPDDAIADRFGARVTPEAFVLDQAGVLVYHGRVDDSQDPANVKSHDLKDALDAVLVGSKPPHPETRAFGCGINRG